MSENGAQARPESSAGGPAAALDPAVDDWVLQADAGETPTAAGSNGAAAGPSSLQQRYSAALKLLQSATADSEVQHLTLSPRLRLSLALATPGHEQHRRASLPRLNTHVSSTADSGYCNSPVRWWHYCVLKEALIWRRP